MMGFWACFRHSIIKLASEADLLEESPAFLVSDIFVEIRSVHRGIAGSGIHRYCVSNAERMRGAKEDDEVKESEKVEREKYKQMVW